MTKPRILFIGGTPRGFELLKVLIANGENIVKAFILLEDEHEVIKVSIAMEEFCRERNIKAEVCQKITKERAADIKDLDADAAFVCGWRSIIPREIYSLFPLGCLAAHDSLLPKYRGCAPLNWAIINGEKETGVTLFKIQDGPVDSGPFCGQKKVKIGPDETAHQVYQRIMSATVELYTTFLNQLASDSVTWIEQNEREAFIVKRRKPQDGEINWRQSSEQVHNLIRALVPPYPCARTFYKGDILFITKSSRYDYPEINASAVPGQVISVSHEGVLVACGQGAVSIKKVIDQYHRECPAFEVIQENGERLGRGKLLGVL
jgi:methionyl-tRNA formyltransferase